MSLINLGKIRFSIIRFIKNYLDMKKILYFLFVLICINQFSHSATPLDWKLETVKQPVAARYGITNRRSIVVVNEVGAGPVGRACIQPGDVVFEVDGKPVEYAMDAYEYDKLPAGSSFNLKIWRNSTGQVLEQTISTELPSIINLNDPGLGMRYKFIFKDELEKYGVKDRLSGIFVEALLQEANVAKAGLKIGDIVVGVDKKPVMMACEFGKILKSLKTGQPSELELFSTETKQIRKIAFTIQSMKELQQGLSQLEKDTKNQALNSEKKKIPLLKIEASVSNPDASGKVEINIGSNNKLVSLKINDAEEGGGNSQVRTIHRFVPIGRSVLHIEFNDEFGQVTTRDFTIERKPADKFSTYTGLNPFDAKLKTKGRDVVALVIGIDGYKNAPPAAFAESDANVFAEYLKSIYGIKPDKIKVLTGAGASRIEIIKSLKTWLPTETKAAATELIVFFAGHGLASEDGKFSYLLPHDSDPNLLDDTALKLDDVLGTIQKLNPKVANIFVDSCYSGQDRSGDSLLPSARPITLKSSQVYIGANINILTSSSSGQFSVSIPEAKHGLFSYFLMRGMGGEADRDGNKKISFLELSDYMIEKVSKESIKLGKSQRPVFQGNGDFVLVGE